MRQALIVCLLAAPWLPAAERNLTDLLPPGARFVMGVRVRSLAESPIAKTIAAEAKTQSPELGAMLNLLGFDPLRDVEEVLIASTGEGQNAPSLVLARGNFNSLPNLPADPRNQMALISPGVLAFGYPPFVKAAQNGVAGAPALAARAAGLSRRFDIYGFGSIPAGKMPNGMGNDLAKTIDHFQFGVTLSHGLNLDAELRARTVEDAGKFAQSIQLLAGLMSKQKGAEDLQQSLKISSSGNTIKIALAVPDAVIQQALNSRAASRSARTSTRPGAAAEPASPREAPSRVPAGAALMITGSESDGGTTILPKQ